MRAINVDTGGIVATGHLVVDLSPDATSTDKVGASVRFVGDAVRGDGAIV